MLLLFDLLFYSSYSMCYYVFLVRPTILFLLFDLLFCSFCSTLMFLLLDIVVLLLLLDIATPLAWHYYSSCSTLLIFVFLGTSLLHPWFCYSLLLLLDTTTFAPLVSNYYSPPPLLLFCKCGGAIQIHVLQARLGRWEFFFQYLFVDEFFLLIHVFGKWWLTMCLFIVCKNYLGIVHLLYTLHLFF
jgi:hypothetical protein